MGPDGTIWVVKADGTVWYRDDQLVGSSPSVDAGWVQPLAAYRAIDIAGAANHTAYLVGINGNVHHWDGNGNTMLSSMGSAQRIAVGADGTLWATTSYLQIWYDDGSG